MVKKKNPPANAGEVGSIPGWEDPLEEEMATHSSTPAWRIPWTEEPVGYSSWGHKEADMTERLNNNKITNLRKCLKLNQESLLRALADCKRRHLTLGSFR